MTAKEWRESVNYERQDTCHNCKYGACKYDYSDDMLNEGILASMFRETQTDYVCIKKYESVGVKQCHVSATSKCKLYEKDLA